MVFWLHCFSVCSVVARPAYSSTIGQFGIQAHMIGERLEACLNLTLTWLCHLAAFAGYEGVL